MRRTLFAFMTTTFVALTLCASTAGATTINFDNLLLGDFGGVIDGVTFCTPPVTHLMPGFRWSYQRALKRPPIRTISAFRTARTSSSNRATSST